MAPQRQRRGERELGAIAQLGERYNGIVEVSGSIPLSSTNLFQKSTRLSAGFFCALVKLRGALDSPGQLD